MNDRSYSKNISNTYNYNRYKWPDGGKNWPGSNIFNPIEKLK